MPALVCQDDTRYTPQGMRTRHTTHDIEELVWLKIQRLHFTKRHMRTTNQPKCHFITHNHLSFFHGSAYIIYDWNVISTKKSILGIRLRRLLHVSVEILNAKVILLLTVTYIFKCLHQYFPRTKFYFNAKAFFIVTLTRFVTCLRR